MGRAALAGGTERGQSGGQLGGQDLPARVGEQHRQMGHPDAVLHQNAPFSPGQTPLPADPVAFRDQASWLASTLIEGAQAQRRRLARGRLQLTSRGLGVSRLTAALVGLRQPPPGGHHRGPVG